MPTRRKHPHPFSIAFLAIMPVCLVLSATLTTRMPVIADDMRSVYRADGLTKHFSGQIANTRSDKIEIVNAVGEDHDFRVADNARITLNGTEASLDTLDAGLRATIQAESRKGQWVAVAIQARRRY